MHSFRDITKCSHGSKTHLIVVLVLPLFCSDGLEQIAADQSRQLLYTRSTKGCLMVFDLGKDGQSLAQVASVTQDQIVQRAMQCTRCDSEGWAH